MKCSLLDRCSLGYWRFGVNNKFIYGFLRFFPFQRNWRHHESENEGGDEEEGLTSGWRRWFCTTCLGQMPGSALSWRPQKSSFKLSPVDLLRCSAPGSLTPTSPSDLPGQRLSSLPLRSVTLKEHHTALERSMCLEMSYGRIPLFLSLEPKKTSSQLIWKTLELPLKDANRAILLKPRQPCAPGASSHTGECCCSTPSRCPKASVAWSPRCSSTSARGSDGWSVSTTVLETLSRSAQTSAGCLYHVITGKEGWGWSGLRCGFGAHDQAFPPLISKLLFFTLFNLLCWTEWIVFWLF